MRPIVTYEGIDEALKNLRYTNKNSLKSKLINTIWEQYCSFGGSVESVNEVDTDFLVKTLWDTEDDPSLIRSRRKNFNSIKSTVNSDLKKLYSDGLNKEGIIINQKNIFDMSDEAKSEMLESFSYGGQGNNQIPLDKITDVLSVINDFISNKESGIESNEKFEQLKELIRDISGKVGISVVSQDSDSSGAIFSGQSPVQGPVQKVTAEADGAIVQEEQVNEEEEEVENPPDDIKEMPAIEIEELSEEEILEEPVDEIDDKYEELELEDVPEEELEDSIEEEVDVVEEPIEEADELEEEALGDDVEIIEEPLEEPLDEADEFEEVAEEELKELPEDALEEELLDDIEEAATEEIEEIPEDEIVEEPVDELDDDEFEEVEVEDAPEEELEEEAPEDELEELPVDALEEELLDDMEEVSADEIDEVSEDEIEEEPVDEIGDDEFEEVEVEDTPEEELEEADGEDDVDIIEEPLEEDLDEVDELEDVPEDELDDDEYEEVEVADTPEEELEETDGEDDVEVIEDPLEESLDEVDELEDVPEEELEEVPDDEIEELSDDALEEELLDDTEEVPADELDAVSEDVLEDELDDDEYEEVEVEDTPEEELEEADGEDDVDIIEEPLEEDLDEVDELEDVPENELEEEPADEPIIDFDDLDEIPEDELEGVPEDEIPELLDDYTLAEMLEDYDTTGYLSEEGQEKALILADRFDKMLSDTERYYNRYLLVPGGRFLTVNAPSKVDSKSPKYIELPDFYFGKFPVTNNLFELFIEKTGYVTTAERQGYGTVYKGRYRYNIDEKSGRKILEWNSSLNSERVDGACWFKPHGPGSTVHGKRNYPVVQVTLEDAMAFAAWTGKRLPTEQEWEAAARTSSGLDYPWGKKPDKDKCNIEASAIGETTPVDKYQKAANKYEIYDLLGNVLEWTSSSESQDGNTLFVTKGGSWVSGENSILTSRFLIDPNSPSNILGFRCITYT